MHKPPPLEAGRSETPPGAPLRATCPAVGGSRAACGRNRERSARPRTRPAGNAGSARSRLTAGLPSPYKHKRMKGNEGKRKSQASQGSFLATGHGKRVRLWRLLYASGPANGTLLVLPLDQGLEHGPSDFFPNPPALDTNFQFRLALEGRYSALALGIGLAEKYMADYAGRVPLILKLNGKTNIPDEIGRAHV